MKTSGWLLSVLLLIPPTTSAFAQNLAEDAPTADVFDCSYASEKETDAERAERIKRCGTESKKGGRKSLKHLLKNEDKALDETSEERVNPIVLPDEDFERKEPQSERPKEGGALFPRLDGQRPGFSLSGGVRFFHNTAHAKPQVGPMLEISYVNSASDGYEGSARYRVTTLFPEHSPGLAGVLYWDSDVTHDKAPREMRFVTDPARPHFPAYVNVANRDDWAFSSQQGIHVRPGISQYDILGIGAGKWVGPTSRLRLLADPMGVRYTHADPARKGALESRKQLGHWAPGARVFFDQLLGHGKVQIGLVAQIALLVDDPVIAQALSQNRRALSREEDVTDADGNATGEKRRIEIAPGFAQKGVGVTVSGSVDVAAQLTKHVGIKGQLFTEGQWLKGRDVALDGTEREGEVSRDMGAFGAHVFITGSF